MPPAHLSKHKGLQNAVLLGRVRSLISGLPEPAHYQQFATYRSSVSLLKHTGSLPDIFRESVNPGKGISTLGVLARAFSIPSASGSSSELYKYRGQGRPGESSTQDTCLVRVSNFMATCSSFQDGVQPWAWHRNGQSLRNYQRPHTQMVVDLSNRMISLNCCSRITGNMKDEHQHGNNMLYRYFWSNAAESAWNLNPSVDPEIQGFHSSCSSSYAAGAAPDVSFDGSVREDQQEKNTSSSDQKGLGDRTLKLLSGSCYLPHPDKEETGGEDAHFICVDEQAVGVADGVGGWADLGVDAGQYARELMSNSVDAIKEEPKGSIDPSRVLEKAYSSTKARGSSTACIVALTDQGIHAVNLGDSGFIVVRDGCTIFRSPVQQHDFNFTYQLESGHGSDLPSSAQVFTFSVAPGDVIVAGTDGLFDNLYNNEITAVVVHAVRAGLGPQVTAQKIAALARERARDKNRQTPFSTAAQDAGYRYYGGKLDDITVVVSYITASSP